MQQIPIFLLTRQHEALRDEIREAVSRVFDSGIFISGPEVAAFEKEFAAWVGAKYAVSVACGFDALKIGLMALGIGRGDEVITAANGCPATPLSIAAAGATPVFTDCDDNYLINIGRIKRAITSRTRAIMPVHLYGRPVDMIALMKIALEHGLRVIEDCAQAHGAEWRGKKVGTFGDLGCFSFYPTKNLGAAGDAGIVVTSNLKLATQVRKVANYGERKRFDSDITGLNSRMDPIQAAILRAKLKHLDHYIRRRREIAKIYIDTLRNSSLRLPGDPASGKHAFHLFVVETSKREIVRKRLGEAGIGTFVHYPIPCSSLKAFKRVGKKRSKFSEAECGAKRILTLPMWPEMTDEEAKRVAREVLRAQKF